MGKTVVITETPRLLIRQLSLDDAAELVVVLGDPEVMRYSVRGVLSEEGTREFIRSCVGLYQERGYGSWALIEKASGVLVGICGLSPERIDGVEEVQIGYRLARQFWGQGLATEAVRAVLEHAIDQHHCESVIAIIAPDHAASIRVATKAGFSLFVCKDYHGWNVRFYRKYCVGVTK